MGVPFWAASGRGQGEDVIADLLRDAVKSGTEAGWFGDAARESAFRDRAQTELVLREQQVNGHLGAAVADLEQTLKDLLCHGATKPVAAVTRAEPRATEMWRLDLRRAMGALLGAVLVGSVAAFFPSPMAQWPLWIMLAALAGLVALGPWSLSRRVRAAAINLAQDLRHSRHWLACGRQDRQSIREIRLIEERIVAERVRRVSHDQWLQHHLALVMGAFHHQRRRAELAAAILGRNHAEHSQEELAYVQQRIGNAHQHDGC